MGNSLMVLCAKMGLHFTACAPKALSFPAPELVDECRKIAEETGATIRLTEDVLEGTRTPMCCTPISGSLWGAGRGLGVPDSATEALSGQRRRHGKCKAHGDFHALLALLP